MAKLRNELAAASGRPVAEIDQRLSPGQQSSGKEEQTQVVRKAKSKKQR